MANTNVSHSEAKSICDALECSPSQHDEAGHYGGKPSLTPKTNEATVNAEKTGEFAMSDRGKRLPNYQRQFARKADQA